jgi:hypothetical protein
MQSHKIKGYLLEIVSLELEPSGAATLESQSKVLLCVFTVETEINE